MVLEKQSDCNTQTNNDDNDQNVFMDNSQNIIRVTNFPDDVFICTKLENQRRIESFVETTRSINQALYQASLSETAVDFAY